MNEGVKSKASIRSEFMVKSLMAKSASYQYENYTFRNEFGNLNLLTNKRRT